ncbi:hypothetical protein [Caulobacter sp. 17J65-9]|uniref:hypothetical protein n=1 Tax=Caulobacter sp. 17J65-9 TaxID=2709382 RepID=UPI0013C9859D|nr:hypothetical protein [Caulobacter sp. 17J65-9]NEX93055.1 hypothetical protein [Caulobacter sp. 17J65-9]
MRRTGVAVLGLIAVASHAQAQSRDPTGSYDVDDGLRQHAYQLVFDQPPTARPVSLDLSLGGTFSSNAGESASDQVVAVSATPGAALYVVPLPLGGWELAGGGSVDADVYAGGYNDQLGEGRLEGFAAVQRPLGPGSLAAEYVAFAGYAHDFADHQYTLHIGQIAYSFEAHGVAAEFTAEYEGSDEPELRRARATMTLEHAVAAPLFGHQVTVEGHLAASDFTAGANDGRTDVFAQVALTAERTFANGWALEWTTALSHRFSNRTSARFTEFDFGPSLSRTF